VLKALIGWNIELINLVLDYLVDRYSLFLGGAGINSL